jgi:Uncharacterized protein conserved in bacteria (DUF2272)
MCKFVFFVVIASVSTASFAQNEMPDPASRIKVTDGKWMPINTQCPTTQIDAKLRQSLVNVAVEEWARFGFPVADHRKKGRDIVVSPEGGPLISPKLNKKIAGIARGALRLGYMEDDKEVRRAIGGYWATVPDQDALVLQSSIFQQYPDAGWAQPWSAAFISYVFCASGVSDLEKFKRSSGHAGYVDQAIQTASGRADGILKARDVSKGLPRPGDLLCADRADTTTPFRNIDDRIANPGGRSMHCDIVVKVQKGVGGYVAMIGGNVVQSVSMTLVNIVNPTVAGPARVETFYDNNSKGARPWFAVLELQADGDVSLDTAPAIKRIKATN